MINDVVAAPAQANAGGDPMMSMFLFGGVMLVMYFLMIRPQSKKAKQQKAMVEALSKGDEVVTAGGLIGKITDVKEQHVTLKLADNVEILIEKSSVSKTLPKGTIKAL
jgi:preprotein translocase subunit YajC